VKKRAKLDLSAGVEPDKAQAAGFEPVTPETPSPEAQEPEPAPADDDVRPPPELRVAGRPLSPGMILKAMAVVAAAGISIYLLKRRLF
jgi:hypothetical protein